MKAVLIVIVAFALGAGGVFADTLVFKDDLELSGPKVEVLREHERGVDVRVSHGTITIPWTRIKRITIDFENHLANMRSEERDTGPALLEFVRLLVRHEMFDQATVVCTLILQKDKVAEDILFGVADQMEKQKEWKHAKTALEMILRVNPARQDVLRRIDEVSKQCEEPAAEPGKEPVGPPVEPVNEPKKDPEKQPAEEPAPPKVVEGLEAEDDWVVEPWGSKADASIVEQGPRIRNKVLSVTYQGTEKDKVAVRLGGTWDFTDREALAFDVWNATDRSLGLSVAFNTMPGWKFSESTARSIRPKEWVTVRISLTEKRFKSEESNWRNTAELVNRDNVKQIILLVYNTSKEGVVYFDNIQLVEKAGPPQ